MTQNDLPTARLQLARVLAVQLTPAEGLMWDAMDSILSHLEAQAAQSAPRTTVLPETPSAPLVAVNWSRETLAQLETEPASPETAQLHQCIPPTLTVMRTFFGRDGRPAEITTKCAACNEYQTWVPAPSQTGA